MYFNINLRKEFTVINQSSEKRPRNFNSQEALLSQHGTGFEQGSVSEMIYYGT